jgi:hypothetical protein
MRGVSTRHPTGGRAGELVAVLQGTGRAEPAFMCSPRLAVAVVVSLVFAGCGGEIVFGLGIAQDAMPASDSGPRDTGPPPPPPDAGMPDIGPPPDTGPLPDGYVPDAGCDPMLPAEWPFERTEQAYRDLFWTGVASMGFPSSGGLKCGAAAACHGGATQAAMKHFIPETDTAVTQRYAEGIDSLWNVMKPVMHVGAPGSEAPLTYSHREEAMGGGDEAPYYSPEVASMLQALIDRAKATSCP